MKKITAVFLLISFLLCSCSKTTEITKEPNVSTRISNEPHKTADITEEPRVSTKITNKPDQSKEKTLNLTETSRPALSEQIYTFLDTNSLQKTNIRNIQLIDFDAENYYFLTADNNYNFTIANKNDKSLKPLYTLSSKNDMFLETVYKGSLLVVFGYWEDRVCHFKFISVNTKGKESILYKGDTCGLPQVSIVGNHAVLNYVGVSKGDVEEESILATINLEDKSYKKIASSQFTRNDFIYTGTFIYLAGGWEDGICYEKIQMNHESIDNDDAGKCSIYYYSFKEGNHEKLIDYPHKILYIRGDRDCFLTSDHLIVSTENSGKITLRENNTYKTYNIPGVIPAFDIMGSYKLSDNDILAYNMDNYWICNIKNKTYYKEKYKYLNDDPENLYKLTLKAYDRQFTYLEPNDDKVIVHTFTLNDVTK